MKSLLATLPLAVYMATAAWAIPTYTTINPTPWPAEVDLSIIVAPYEADGWVRVPDNLDTVFPLAGWGSTYLFAVEDQPAGDFDFNDWVGLCSWEIGCTQIAGYSASTQTVTFQGSPDAWTFGFTTPGDYSTAGWRSDWVHGPDRIITWGLPIPEITPVPEPAMFLPLGLGLVALWRLRRKGLSKQ